LADDRMME